MIVLKIIGWILLVIIGLIILNLIFMVLAMCVKITIGVDAGGDGGFGFHFKYGFFGIRYPESFTEKHKEKAKKIYGFLNYHFGDKVKRKKDKLADKIENKVEEKKEIKEIEKDLKLEEEEKKASEPSQEDKKEEAKDFAEKLRNFDFYAYYKKITDFLSGFDIESATAFLSKLTSKSGRFFKKMIKHFKFSQLFLGFTVTGDDAAKTAVNYGTLCATVYPIFGKMLTMLNVGKYDIELSPDFLAEKNSAELHLEVKFRPIVLINCLMGYVISMLFFVKGTLSKADKKRKDKSHETENVPATNSVQESTI